MSRMNFLLAPAAAGAILLGWAQMACAQVPNGPPGGPEIHYVRILYDGDDYRAEPESLEVDRTDWVVWIWEFATQEAEVNVCKGFVSVPDPAFRGVTDGPGQGPGKRCVEITEQVPAVIKMKVRVGAPSGSYQYLVAFVTADGEDVIIDPELIIRPRG